MKKLLLSGLLLSVVSLVSLAQSTTTTGTPLSEYNFTQGADGIGWAYVPAGAASLYAISQANNPDALQIDATTTGGYTNMGFLVPVADVASSVDLTNDADKKITFVAKATADVTVRMDFQDGSGNATSLNAKTILVSGDGDYHVYTLTFADADFFVYCTTPCTPVAVDETNITDIAFFTNAGGAAYTGTIWIDYMAIGDVTVDIVSGTKSAQANIASSKLYPNPVSGLANVELNLKSNSDVKVTLSDMMGKEVMVIADETTASLNRSFNTSGLNQGLYTVNYFINGSPAKAELLMVK